MAEHTPEYDIEAFAQLDEPDLLLDTLLNFNTMLLGGIQGVVFTAPGLDSVQFQQIWGRLVIPRDMRTGIDPWNLYYVNYHTHFELPAKTPLMIEAEAALSNGMVDENPQRVLDLMNASQVDMYAHDDAIEKLRLLHPWKTVVVLATNSYVEARSIPMIIEPEKYPTVVSVEPTNYFCRSNILLWGVSKYSR